MPMKAQPTNENNNGQNPTSNQLIKSKLLLIPHHISPMPGFSPTKLASTWFTSDESQWPQGSSRRCLFGQALLYCPYPTGSSETATFSAATNASSGNGRFLDEKVLETVYRHQGDDILDDLLMILHQEGRPIGDAQDLLALASASSSSQPTSDGTVNGDFARGDKALADFVRHASTVPSWVDWDQVRRGQTVFLAYAPSIGASLFYRSLVPGFSIPKIAVVLQATAYLAPPATREHVTARLVDTGGFVAAILAQATNGTNAPALAPHSLAWTMALQVRVLHAKVRRRLLQRTKQAWNTPAYGIPINQQDLAATLLGFSYNAMMGSEMILGRPWPISERLDFLAFWRYIGWLLGVQTLDKDIAADESSWPPLDPCGPGWYHDNPDPLAHAYAMFGSILLHLTKPDATSVEIAHHLLRLGKAPNLPTAQSYHEATHTPTRSGSTKTEDWWFYFRSYQCRRFAGHELGDALCLPYHPSWYRRVQIQLVSTFYLCMLRLYSWAAWPASPLRPWIVSFHQRQFTRLVTHWHETKHGATSHGSAAAGSCPFAMVRPPP